MSGFRLMIARDGGDDGFYSCKLGSSSVVSSRFSSHFSEEGKKDSLVTAFQTERRRLVKPSTGLWVWRLSGNLPFSGQESDGIEGAKSFEIPKFSEWIENFRHSADFLTWHSHVRWHNTLPAISHGSAKTMCTRHGGHKSMKV